MKRLIIKVICLCLCLSMLSITFTGCSSSGNNADNNHAEEETAGDNTDNSTDATVLSTTQQNSVAMLNYLAMLSQEIENTKSSRVLLESAKTSLMNNVNPDKIDEKTQDHITSLLDIIEEYRVIAVKRDRLHYLYNQDKAETIRKAIPNPLAVISVTNAFDWPRLAASVAYTAMDSYNNYKSANADLDKQYMINGWELDDQEEEVIHKNRTRAFNYMVDIVQEYDLPGNLALSEEDIQSFVNEAVNSDNNYQKLQFLESREGSYDTFGYYWLERADSYYEAKDYTRCLECIDKYNELDGGIFRKDLSYAAMLPKVIVAAQETVSDSEYVTTIRHYTEDIMQNADNTDWALRYFAAQSYMDLYSKTDDENYLKEVYEIALNNVNQLVKDQETVNATYLNDVKEIKFEEDAELTKQENKENKKQIKDYNKYLKKTRETELPTVFEPLALNCDLLFSMAEELDISDSEKSKIEGILQTNKSGVFLSKPINEAYSFEVEADSEVDFENKMGGLELFVPADLLVSGSEIVTTIKTSKGTDKIDDWKIKKVKRDGNSVSDFIANYTSKKISKVKWNKGATVSIDINYADMREPKHISYTVSEYKNNPLIPDKIKFKRQ